MRKLNENEEFLACPKSDIIVSELLGSFGDNEVIISCPKVQIASPALAWMSGRDHIFPETDDNQYSQLVHELRGPDYVLLFASEYPFNGTWLLESRPSRSGSWWAYSRIWWLLSPIIQVFLRFFWVIRVFSAQIRLILTWISCMWSICVILLH